MVTNMRDAMTDLDKDSVMETYNDVSQFKREAMSAFKLGVIDLREKAVIETIYWKTLKKIQDLIRNIEWEELQKT